MAPGGCSGTMAPGCAGMTAPGGCSGTAAPGCAGTKPAPRRVDPNAAMGRPGPFGTASVQQPQQRTQATPGSGPPRPHSRKLRHDRRDAAHRPGPNRSKETAQQRAALRDRRRTAGDHRDRGLLDGVQRKRYRGRPRYEPHAGGNPCAHGTCTGGISARQRLYWRHLSQWRASIPARAKPTKLAPASR